MKNQKLRKVRPNRHIPSDLIPEILSRLPVKSLLRFRCVSKSWLSLVDDDAEFARLHLKNFKNNSDETHLLVVHKSRGDCVVRRSDTFEPDSGTIHTLKKHYRAGQWKIVCSVDGLILLRQITVSYICLKLWNPSNRKFRQVPLLPYMPEIEKSSGNGNRVTYYNMGLGYDSLSKDYKLVILVCEGIYQKHVLIYSLRENSWKVVEFQVKGSSCSNWSWDLCRCSKYLDSRGWSWDICSCSLYFQGCLYLLYVKELVSFDLRSEVFSFVTMPEINHFYDSRQLALVDGGCSLAIFDTCGGREYSIWVLETGSMSWMKRYSFRLKFLDFLYLKSNGEILIRGCRTEKNTPENGEKKKIVRCDQVISYIPETDEYKIVDELKSSYYMISHICGYVESLLLHK